MNYNASYKNKNERLLEFSRKSNDEGNKQNNHTQGIAPFYDSGNVLSFVYDFDTGFGWMCFGIDFGIKQSEYRLGLMCYPL
jgi:hypothetical protein